MDPHVYIFKKMYGDMVRRMSVRVPYDIRYEQHGEGPHIMFTQLQTTIREAFQIPPASKVSSVYTDRDDDEVSMVHDSDIQDACVPEAQSRPCHRSASSAPASVSISIDSRPS